MRRVGQPRCDFSRDIGQQGTVECLKGRFGGMPHVGVCRTHCPDCKLPRNSSPLKGEGRERVAPDAAMIQRGRAPWLIDRIRICTPACDETCGMHHQSTRKRRCTLARPNFHCPKGRF